MEIIRGPLTVYDALIGGTAHFECIINSVSVFPRWNIDGIDFTVTNLPVGFEFESDSYSKILTLDPVREEMNNSVFYCFLQQINSRLESTKAKLIIPALMPNRTIQCLELTPSFTRNSSLPSSLPPTSTLSISYMLNLSFPNFPRNTGNPTNKVSEGNNVTLIGKLLIHMYLYSVLMSQWESQQQAALYWFS